MRDLHTYQISLQWKWNAVLKDATSSWGGTLQQSPLLLPSILTLVIYFRINLLLREKIYKFKFFTPKFNDQFSLEKLIQI